MARSPDQIAQMPPQIPHQIPQMARSPDQIPQFPKMARSPAQIPQIPQIPQMLLVERSPEKKVVSDQEIVAALGSIYLRIYIN